VPVPPQPGQGGLVPGKQYRIFIFSIYGRVHDWRGYEYDFGGPVNDYLRNQWGPAILNAPASLGTETTERDWSHWGQGIISHDELVGYSGSEPVASVYIQDGSGGYSSRTISSFSYRLERVDGTTEEQDKIESGFPPKPGIDQTTTTPTPTGSPSPDPPAPPAPFPPGATPTAPPPIAPPKPAKPTPTGTGGSSSASPSPSPQPQSAPPPTTTPSAPKTTSGNPTNNAPTTGPRPSPGGSNQSGGQSGGGQTGGGAAKPLTDPGQIAALIAGTSPGVAGIIWAINNSAQPKQPTPTGAPIKLPDNNSPTTGPDNRPPEQGDPVVVPGQTEPLKNEQGQTIGNSTEFKDKNGNVIYTITQITNNTTNNNVTNQINQSTTQNNTLIQNTINQITNPTPPPTNVTTVNNITQTEQITNNVQNVVNNQTETINQNTTNIVNNSTTTITETVTTTTTNQLTQLLEKSDVDLASTLAILATLATAVALEQSKNQTLTAIGNIPTPTPCTYPTFHPQNQAERAAISGKVDGVNTVLGTVTNVQIAEAKTGINSIIGAIGTPLANTGTTIFEGINKIQVWGDKFSKSLRLDRVYNALAVMLQIHNAAILSRNLGESLGFLIDASLQALRLKDENDEEFNLTQVIGTSIENFIKSIIGNDIYNGLSRQWKLISAIYSSAINIYEMSLSAFGGLAEGVSVIGEYQGKIGNALKRSGGVMQNAYDWMEENFKIKMTRAGYLGRVADGLQEAEDVVANVTEFPESINEVYSTYDEAADEIKEARQAAEQLRQVKITTETQNKTDSQSPNIADNDAFKPPI
jgi:hypothetical protein